MKRHAKGSAFDISIRYDELEQSRRLLENKLKASIPEPSLPLASDDDDDDHYHFNHNHKGRRRPHHHDNESVEYPRHDSGAIPYPDFPSFAHRSGDFAEVDSQMQGWSYRTGDDDEGINPYTGGETMSSVAHHASAVTITTGLARGGGRRDISMSGAEYDPERPLNRIMAGVGRMSMFDDASKSKNNNTTTFEPLVVDSTAELDRILQSGYAPQLSVHPTPPMSHASSSSESELPSGSPSRASRLADHLRNVPFSPKRPRTGLNSSTNSPQAPPQKHKSPSHHSQYYQNSIHLGSPLPKKKSGANVSVSNLSMNMATPKSKRVLSGGSNRTPVSQHRQREQQQPPQPEVRLQPPTPSTVSSRFTKMARGIARDIEEEVARPASAPPASTHKTTTTPRRAALWRDKEHSTSKSRIVLPDVTGLTMAVESPARMPNEYQMYAGKGPREAEVRLLQALNSVQSKLSHLNEENAVSRRRVRELEMELDECKRDVVRERTRLLEKEEIHGGSGFGNGSVRYQEEKTRTQKEKEKTAKGKSKVVAANVEDPEEVTKRYKEAVEEKKALEALINGLRTHLTRLTSELASHQELLVELRDLRETDSRKLEQKGNEIVRLGEEVERLAGEVEVLRGVVEEGLRERRKGKKEGNMNEDGEPRAIEESGDVGMSRDLEDERQGANEDEHASEDENGSEDGREETRDDPRQQEEEDLEGFDSSVESSVRIVDRTMRTDHATLGSSRFGGNATAMSTPHRVQFVDQREIDEITAEVEERRSNGSIGGGGADISVVDRVVGRGDVSSINGSFRSRSPSPMPVRRPSYHQHTQGSLQGQRASSSHHSQWPERPRNPAPPPTPSIEEPRGKPPSPKAQNNTRSQEPTKVPSKSQAKAHPKAPEDPETPFPQIRGERLERLFFSAPEHNPRTCNVCYRRRGREDRDTRRSPSGVPRRTTQPRQHAHPANDEDGGNDEDDEGFSEGLEDDGRREWREAFARGKGKAGTAFGVGKGGVALGDTAAYRSVAEKRGVPPQTVVARVVRDLEDDFTHYKSVYVELADQYKDMDPASDVPRRNLVARHLREVVDILEQKGDQIASLYELLSFKDIKAGVSGVPSTRGMAGLV